MDGIFFFPAYAGLFLGLILAGVQPRPFPRVCGVDPQLASAQKVGATFSPRMRGWSPRSMRSARCRRLFPAYVGLFLDRLHRHADSGWSVVLFRWGRDGVAGVLMGPSDC